MFKILTLQTQQSFYAHTFKRTRSLEYNFALVLVFNVSHESSFGLEDLRALDPGSYPLATSVDSAEAAFDRLP